MQFVTIIAIAAFVIASVYMIFSLPVAIFRSMQRGPRFRAALAKRLGELRLPRMLGALGIQHDRYLAQHRVVDVETHMKNCRQCDETRRCDADLDRGRLTDDGAYCPNRRHFARVESNAEERDKAA